MSGHDRLWERIASILIYLRSFSDRLYGVIRLGFRPDMVAVGAGSG
jgi:hypothetical protein